MKEIKPKISRCEHKWCYRDSCSRYNWKIHTYFCEKCLAECRVLNKHGILTKEIFNIDEEKEWEFLDQ